VYPDSPPVEKLGDETGIFPYLLLPFGRQANMHG